MRAVVVCPLWLGGLLLASAGCATTPAVAPSAPFLIAVRYDVESEILAGSYEAVVMGRDFSRIAELGFNTIAFYHVDDRERHRVVSEAQDAGLRVLVQPQSFRHYISAGALPKGCLSVQRLADAGIAGPSGEEGSWTPLVDFSGVAHGSERGQRLASALVSRGHSCVTVGGPDGSGGLQSLAVVDLDVGAGKSDAAPLEPWLAAYHRGLLQGKTGGVLFDRYRFPGGGPSGLGPRDGSLDAARAAAIGELLSRARVWGPRLYQFAVVPCEATRLPDGDVRVAGLVRGSRRYALVFNRSLTQYARGDVVLAGTMDGREVNRAVEVPASAACPAGRVFIGRGGQLVLPIQLRPGDAALFELF